ncbi:MAG: crossover junction endodeoxyribonuclease RuvC [Gemmatimonadetes bacterium]|nr:crossover junction endodeoxyribonuclease RuvC [Gemmatimonadota bacterium]MBK9692546.1 crossover junction endodeoxyribonuclease RuvC [Gemmatimonadota bacterium]
MKVLGVDPGTAATGYGVVEDAGPGMYRLLECGVIRPERGATLPHRLLQIHEQLAGLVARHQPEVLAVEEAFHARNARTTLVLGHARGVILLAGAAAGVAIAEYSPAEIKKTVTGRGQALKPQVAFMVAQLLRLKAVPRPADAADGCAVALTHLLGTRRRVRR